MAQEKVGNCARKGMVQCGTYRTVNGVGGLDETGYKGLGILRLGTTSRKGLKMWMAFYGLK